MNIKSGTWYWRIFLLISSNNSFLLTCDTTQHKTQTRNARSKMNKAENEAYAALIFKAIKYVILRDDIYGSINLVLTYAKKYFDN